MFNLIKTCSRLQLRSLLCPVILSTTLLLFTGCKKYTSEPKSEDQILSNRNTNVDQELLTYYKGLDKQTLLELQQARAATARYRNVNNAFADNYVDIGLKLPNMGYHFLKSALVTPVFDIKQPPILVYNKNEDGSFELLAVEYAVPIDPQTPNVPPAGFSGDDDQWDFNTLNTGWWTLHAWVWKNNPDGVFNPMNPLVEVR
jgi:hypothetical protein